MDVCQNHIVHEREGQKDPTLQHACSLVWNISFVMVKIYTHRKSKFIN